MTSRSAFDVAVLGAGPAGAAAALAAARAGARVVLCEPQVGSFDKPCGEGIMPAGISALHALGLGVLARRGRPFERLRFFLHGRVEAEVALSSPGIALQRAELQEALELALAAEAFVQRIAATAQTETSPEGIRLVTSAGTLVAGAMVAASGAARPGMSASPLERTASLRSSGLRVGLRARFLEGAEFSGIEIHLGGLHELFVTPLPEGRINLAVLRTLAPGENPSPAQLLDAALEEHPSLRARLGERTTDPESRLLSQARPRRVCEPRVFLAGDAGGGVDPILGCGVTIALRTGIIAGRSAAALAGGADPARISRGYERAYADEVRARRRLALILSRLARYPRCLGLMGLFARTAPGALARVVERAASGRKERRIPA